MNKVTQEQINHLLDTAEIQEHVFWNKELLVSYKLANGFTISGRGACVDPKNFDIEIGRKVARESAEHQLWQLEGYLLQHKLHIEALAIKDLKQGMIVNYVLPDGKSKGESRPAIVVRVWGVHCCNLMVFVDGDNDYEGGNIIWATSRNYSDNKELGTWHWTSEV